jgi:hypothetical protein
MPRRNGVTGEGAEKYREAADRQPAAPEVPEVDSVVTLEVSLDGVRDLSQYRGERL